MTAILWHKNFLYSVSYDGCIKMWDGTNLELVMEVKKAHDGQRIQCGAIGPDGFLYTGGDDKVSASCKTALCCLCDWSVPFQLFVSLMMGNASSVALSGLMAFSTLAVMTRQVPPAKLVCSHCAVC